MGGSGTPQRYTQEGEEARDTMSGFTPQPASESTPTQDTSSGSINVHGPPEKVHRSESSGAESSLQRGETVPAMPVLVSERAERSLDEETVEMGSPDLLCIASENASAKSPVQVSSSRTSTPSISSTGSAIQPARASEQVQSVQSSPKVVSVCPSPVVQTVHSSPKVISVHASPVVHSVRSSPQIVHSSPKVSSVHGSPENTASSAASPKTVRSVTSRPGSAAGRSSVAD